jgi:hypothetical protein
MRVLFASHRHDRFGSMTTWFAVTRLPVFRFQSNSSKLVVRDNLGQPVVALRQLRAASERLASIALTRFPGPFVPGPVGQTRREREERQRDIYDRSSSVAAHLASVWPASRRLPARSCFGVDPTQSRTGARPGLCTVVNSDCLNFDHSDIPKYVLNSRSREPCVFKIYVKIWGTKSRQLHLILF